MTEEEARSKSGLLTVKETAAELRVVPMTVYRLINAGTLGALRIGGAYRIPEAELTAFKRRSSTVKHGED